MSLKKIVLLWDGSTMFHRYLLVKGYESDVIKDPQVLYLPVPYKLAIVPAGFGNVRYSGMLKRLRASRRSIEHFVRTGGVLLASGAISDDENAYDWLPQTLHLKYKSKFEVVKIEIEREHEATSLVESDKCMCDGYFEVVEGAEVLIKGNNHPILVASNIGKGEIIATTIHEFPSIRFINYCLDKR